MMRCTKGSSIIMMHNHEATSILLNFYMYKLRVKKIYKKLNSFCHEMQTITLTKSSEYIYYIYYPQEVNGI